MLPRVTDQVTRRDFIGHLSKGAAIAALAGGMGMESCSLESALTEALNIVTLLAPLGDGIAAIVAISDPGLALAVTAATKIYDAGVAAVESLLKQWAAAAASAQPGILAQALTAVKTLQQQASALISAAQVKTATAAAEINAITGAVLSEISALLTAIPEIGVIGGTTAAAAKLARGGMFRGVDLRHARSARQWRGDLVSRLKTPTGTAIDPARTTLAANLAALPLK